MKISASFLACKKIKKGIKKLSLTDVEFIHVDVVDGKFVQGRKIPFYKLKRIYKYTSKRLDVHLMVKKPKRYIQKLAPLNAENIIIPVEVEKKLEQNLELIKSYGIKCGLAISPKTDIAKLRPYLDKIDIVLVMGVEPGYGGQPFIEETISRIKEIKEMILEMDAKVLVSVDGGVNDEVAKRLKNVDILVAGSYITNKEDYQKQIDNLRKSCE